MSQPPETPPPTWAPPSWAPPRAASPGPVPGAGYPAGPAPAPARPTGLLLVVGGVLAGLLVGVLASGLVVAALFRSSAEDIGETLADRLGPAVEQAVVDGTVQAMEKTMEEGYGLYPDELGMPGAPVPAAEQFAPVPPEALGPDAVLDSYAQECFGGDLQACDDLMYESPPMSDYEEYALTCGGRVKGYAVAACTELE